MSSEKAFVIHLHLSRRSAILITAALLTASVLVRLVITQDQALASDAQAPAAATFGQYYLTKTSYYGYQANGSGVCSSGYHFASLWEIAQTAALSYNTTLGAALADSGQGPADSYGWIRTGGQSNNSTKIPGTANCSDWTASNGYGTIVALTGSWQGDPTTNPTILGWDAETSDCGIVRAGVWCVGDAPANMREYYATRTSYYGFQAKGSGVCASGYHFASLWEIAQTALLKYNTTLGATWADSGQGPAGCNGWIRTGNPNNNSTKIPGYDNCNTWTSGIGYKGTMVSPIANWQGDPTTNPNFLGWDAATSDCYSLASVWCVQDWNPGLVFLPYIQKH